MLKRILGLDLGISSIGWALIETNDNIDDLKNINYDLIKVPTFKIIDCGVRLFDEPIARNNSGIADGTSNSKRREKRLNRRRLKRKKQIMLQLKQTFAEKGLATKEQLGIYLDEKNELNNNLLMLPKGEADKNIDIWQLRSEALERKITDFELCRILLHIAKHRGPDFEKNATLEELEDLRKKEEENKKQKDGKEATESEKMKNSMLNLRIEYKNAKNENSNITIGKLLFDKREKSKTKDNEDKYKDGHAVYKLKDHIRNQKSEYRYIISREFLREEIDKIFEIQSKYQDSAIHKLDKDEIKNLIFSEKEPQNIENMIGICDLEFKTIIKERKNKKGKIVKYEIIDIQNSQKRISKDTFTGQLFSAINSINTLKIKGEDYSGLLIDYINKDNKKEAIKQILKYAIFNNDEIRNELTYNQLKKKFLNDGFIFCNLSYKDNSKKDKNSNKKEKTEEEIIKTVEGKKFISFSSLFRLNKFLSSTKDWNNIIEEIKDIDKIIDFYFDKNIKLKIDELVEIIHLNNKSEAKEKLKNLGYSQDFIEKAVNLNFSKTLNLSYKAIKKILPFMLKGKQYMNAIDEIPEYKKRFEKEKDYLLKDYAELELVKNPVIRRIFAETKKVINAIIQKYKIDNKTAFHQINIETTRELKTILSKSKSVVKRDENSYEILKKEYLELLGLSQETFVSKNELFKFKLLKQQDYKSIYSGESLMENGTKESACKLIRSNSFLLQIDHILPYHRSFDDSQNNKVLVKWTENQEKGNKTPYEWFKNKYKNELEFNEKWNIFKDRILKCSGLTKEKRSNLLNKTFAEQEGDFQARNLNDTGYISKFMGTYLEKHLKFLELKSLKNHVQRRSGNLTSTLRECWSDEFDYEKNGFSKLKEFLLNEIFKLNEKMDNLTGEVFEKYTINRKEINENKNIKYVLNDKEKEKIVNFFDENLVVKNNFILEKLLETLPEYGTYKNYLTKSSIIRKIKDSMKWSGFWKKEGKDRKFSDKHHALDAILISLADQSMVQILSVCNSNEAKKLQKELNENRNNKEIIENSKRRFKNLLKKIFKTPIVQDKIEDEGKKLRDYIEEFLEERKIKEDKEYFEDYLKELEKNPDKKPNRKCRLFISHSSNNKVNGKLFDDIVFTNNKKYKIQKPSKNYKNKEIDNDKKGILFEFTSNNKLRSKEESCNFADKQSWARADIFKITNLDKKGNIKISYKIQEVFKKDLKNPNTPKANNNEKIEFLFSLYYNNYVIIKKDNNFDCCIGLYKSSHLNRNCFKINPIENTSNNTGLPKNFEDIGISNLKIFKKFQIDVLGYINEIKNEKRQNINT